MIRVLLLAGVLAAANIAAAESVYRWTDAQGKIHYTSEPPPGTPANAVRPRTSSVAPQTAPRAPGAPAATAVPVVMYATSWCPYCAKARAYFRSKGIAYTEFDVEKSGTAHAEFKKLGGRGVPLILVGRERVSGFSELAFEFALQKASR
ncbi:MAG TPA: glutaredoxin domain-containing protein [Burkholderiales bacterium]|nr:glutaredoxin domain-containing protein [Burkholderiales bacterium]